MGDCSEYDVILQYFLNDIELPENIESMLLPAADGSTFDLPPELLPATATICSCHNVTKGDIANAIEDGCTNLAEIKNKTAASTGCGGCADLLNNIVNLELTSCGFKVNIEPVSYTHLTLPTKRIV